MGTNLPRLTHHVAKNPPRASTEVFLWADEPKGFGLRVPAQPDRAPSYIFAFRLAGGRNAPQGRIKIGRNNELRFTEAKALAQEYRAAVLRGEDPREVRERGRSDARTVADLVDAWKIGGANLDRRAGANTARRRAASLVAADIRRIEAHVLPILGSKRLSGLTRRDIERLRDAIASGKTARVERTGKLRGKARIRGGDGTATRTIRVFSSACAWGVEQGWLETNPVAGVKLTTGQPKERFLNPDELKRLGIALADAEAEARVNPSYVAIIRLLLLTGARKGEIESLRWEEVDLRHGLITKPTSKTGRKTIVLNSQALDLLSRIQRYSDRGWLFPSAANETHLKDTSKAFRRIADMAELPETRLHDLRHTFASYGAASGLGLPVVGSLLGHTNPSTTARYAHLADNPRTAAAEAIGATITGYIGEVHPKQNREKSNPE